MLMTLLVVPTRHNNGRRFRRDEFEELEVRLRAFGGFQVVPGVYGEWVSPEGKSYPDFSRLFRCELPADRLTEWLAVVAWARTYLEQEAMWIEIHGQGTICGR